MLRLIPLAVLASLRAAVKSAMMRVSLLMLAIGISSSLSLLDAVKSGIWLHSVQAQPEYAPSNTPRRAPPSHLKTFGLLFVYWNLGDNSNFVAIDML